MKDSSLPPIWVMGFTGHRRLQDPAKIEVALRQVIDSVRKEIPGELIGYSSVAIGADSLFAEACLAAAMPWIALLPQPEDDFKSDFNEVDWTKTSGLLERATSVQTLPGTRDRNVAYLECGLSTVEEADLMIAVWDGQASRGTGGTAEVVAHARNLGKPLIIIDPNRLEVRREGFALEFFSDSEMDYLNSLPGRDGASANVADPEQRVQRFFDKVDAEAARIAPRFRRLVAASVIMNGLAAILIAAAIGFNITSVVFNALIFLLLGAAMVAIALLKRKGAHRNWIRCRVAAEICRSALVTWKLGDLAAPVWFSRFEGFGRLAKSIRLLKASDKENRAADFKVWRRIYLRNRVDEQIDYFRRRARRLSTALAIFMGSFWLFSILGVSRTIYTALTTVPVSDDFIARALQSFLPIALPLAAGCALSLISIFDLNRQLARCKAMEALLTEARAQIEKCESLSTLRRAVEHTENAFAGEVFEWFTLFRYPRFT